MPTELKVAIVVNVVSAVAIAVITVSAFAGGGFVSGVSPEREVHEMVLVPVSPEEAQRLRRVPDVKTADAGPNRAQPESGRRVDDAATAETLPQYRTNDAIPSPWVAMPDGSVRMLRND